MPHLSIVIPAFNEEKRLPKTLDRMLPYLRSCDFSFEVLIVDDGSRDATAAMVRDYATRYPEIQLLGDGANHGRGAAVKTGVYAARGDLVLETDSDGSVADEAVARFVAHLDAHAEVGAVFGSRELAESVITQYQPPLRVFLGYGFIYLARLVFWMWSTTDFTLGFKMYRRAVARDVHDHQFDPFYVAEAEKCFVAKLRGHKVVELPVTWTDDPDSRVRPLRDSVRSLRGVIGILLRFIKGSYR